MDKYKYINGRWVDTTTGKAIHLGNRIKNSNGDYILLNSDGTSTKVYDAKTGEAAKGVSAIDVDNMRKGNVQRGNQWTLDTDTDFDTWFTGNFKELDYKYSHNNDFLKGISKYGINPYDKNQWADILEIVGQEEYKGLTANTEDVAKTLAAKKLNDLAKQLHHGVTVNYKTYNNVTNPLLKLDDKRKETSDVLNSQAKINGGETSSLQLEERFNKYKDLKYAEYLAKLKERNLVTKLNETPISKEDFGNFVYNDFLKEQKTGLLSGLNKASNVIQSGLYVMPTIASLPAIGLGTLIMNAAPLVATYGMLKLAGNHKESVWIKDNKGRYINLQLTVDGDGNYVDDLSKLKDSEGNPISISKIYNSKGQEITSSNNLLNNKYVQTGVQALSMAGTRGIGTLASEGFTKAAGANILKDVAGTASGFYTFTGMEDLLDRKDSDPWYTKMAKDIALGATTTASGLLTGKLLSGGGKELYNDLILKKGFTEYAKQADEAILRAELNLEQAQASGIEENINKAVSQLESAKNDKWNIFRTGRPVANTIQALPKIAVGTATTPLAILVGKQLGETISDASPWISQNYGDDVNDAVQSIGQTAAAIFPFHYAGKINNWVSQRANEGYRNALGLLIAQTGGQQQGRAPIENVAEAVFGVNKPDIRRKSDEEILQLRQKWKKDFISALSPIHRTETGGFRFGYDHIPENGKLVFKAATDPLFGKVDMNASAYDRTKPYIEQLLDNYKLKELPRSQEAIDADKARGIENPETTVENTNVSSSVMGRGVYTGRVTLNGNNGQYGLESFGQDANKISADDMLNSPIAQMIFGILPESNKYTLLGYFLDENLSDEILNYQTMSGLRDKIQFDYPNRKPRILFADESSDNVNYRTYSSTWDQLVKDGRSISFKDQADFELKKKNYFDKLELNRNNTLDILKNGEFVTEIGLKGEFLNGNSARTANNTTGHVALIIKYNGEYYSVPRDLFKIGASDFAISHTKSNNKKKIYAQSVLLSGAESQGSPEIHLQSAKKLSASEVLRLMRHNSDKSNFGSIENALKLNLENNKGGNKSVRDLLLKLQMGDEDVAPILLQHPEIYENLVKNRDSILQSYKDNYTKSLDEAKVNIYGKYESLKKEYALQKETLKKTTTLTPEQKKTKLAKLKTTYDKRIAKAKTSADIKFKEKKAQLLFKRLNDERKFNTLLNQGKFNYGGNNIKGTPGIDKSLKWNSSELKAYKKDLNAQLDNLFTPLKSGKLSLKAEMFLTKLRHPELLIQGYNQEVVDYILKYPKVKLAIESNNSTTSLKKDKRTLKHENGGQIQRVLDKYELSKNTGELSKFLLKNIYE